MAQRNRRQTLVLVVILGCFLMVLLVIGFNLAPDDHSEYGFNDDIEETSETTRRKRKVVSVHQVVHDSSPIRKQRRQQQQQQQQQRKQQNSSKNDRPISKENGLLPSSSGLSTTQERRKPRVPLDRAKLDILKTAQPVDLTFVNVVDGRPREHPHMGALDLMGNPGYVSNATFLKDPKNRPDFQYGAIWGACRKRDAHHKMLTEKVFVDLEGDREAQQSGKKRIRIMCTVYSTAKEHDNIAKHILQTWG